MKAFNLNQRMFLFGTDGNTTELSLSQESNGADWVVSNAELAADAWMNVAVSGNTLYVKNGSTLMKTTDGSSWTLLSSTVGISKLVGATTARLYGISAEGMLVASEDEGVTWAAETLDSDVSMLPTRSINYSCNAVTTNEKTDRIILVGTRDITAYPNDTTAVVWGKVDEYAERAISHAWTYYTPDMQNHLMLPRLSNLSAISYAGGILAIGGNGEGACTAKGYQRFYQSTDGGITWLNNKYYPMPAGLNVGTSAALATDSQKNIWIFCGGSGQIWRGRQNKMGWAEVQKKFQE